jgi:tetratricopeptide (TPR) repeat protein
MAAACVLRPQSALFQLQLGACYDRLEAYDLAVAAFRKSIALFPESAMAYRYLGRSLAKKKDEKGAMAALEEAFRIRPDGPRRVLSHSMVLLELGRPAEAFHEIADAVARFPAWAEDPRLSLRDAAACAAMHCADGKGLSPVSIAERPPYRKKAFEFLAADLAALEKIAESDLEFVLPVVRRWRVDHALENVRPPRTANLPPDERKGWEELWARVQALSEPRVSAERSGSP